MTNYIPINGLAVANTGDWVFTDISRSYAELVSHGAVAWCMSNLAHKWTMCGPCITGDGFRFGFEDSGDATAFYMKFGFSTV